MPSSDYVIALTTLPAEADAHAFASSIVEERLAACVNVLAEMLSIYRWQGKVERAAERQVIIKTTGARVAALRARLRQLHPYDVPEFVVLPILDGDGDYLKWVRDSTVPSATR